jgi:exosortase/archaeosortase family protein
MIQSSRRYLGLVLSPRGFITLLLSVGGFGVFCVVTWSWLQVTIAEIVAGGFSAFGYNVHVAAVDISVDGYIVRIGPKCTYADLILMAQPFMWYPNATFRANIRRMLLLTAVVFVVNVIRIAVTLFLSAHNVSWIWAHDLVNFLIYYSLCAVIIVFWLRATGLDRRMADHAWKDAKKASAMARRRKGQSCKGEEN